LFASTAIGVSHLVQSTRAGANFGFALIPFIVAANIFKFPFFEFGSRYANAAGESIIDGYKRIGSWMLWAYFLITLGSMFFVSAAVGAVTSGFMQNLFGISSDYSVISTILLFGLCLILLLIGRYKLLDALVKVVAAVLLVSTITAFILAMAKGPGEQVTGFTSPDIWSDSSLFFIIALMGWMPTAVDLSAWNSLWTIERIKQTGYKPTLKETLFDFNVGYWISAILSICFVVLGAYMVFGSGKELPNSSGAFAHSVVGLFTGFIGEWSYLIIACAAFSIMFSTCITVFDGYSRSLERTTELLFRQSDVENQQRKVYAISLIIVVVGAFLIVYFFSGQLKGLVDLATTISFLIAPLIAIMNYRLVTGKFIAKEAQPGIVIRLLSWSGILFLSIFAVYFIYLKLSA
jgi:Mn2+/Fe2+ NRAMP family transporter